LVGDLVKVESASDWASLEEVDGRLLKLSVVVDEGDVNALVLKYCR
jgi:hypothetical protein